MLILATMLAAAETKDSWPVVIIICVLVILGIFFSNWLGGGGSDTE